jgi:hypothetical protein
LHLVFLLLSTDITVFTILGGIPRYELEDTVEHPRKLL